MSLCDGSRDSDSILTLFALVQNKYFDTSINGSGYRLSSAGLCGVLAMVFSSFMFGFLASAVLYFSFMERGITKNLYKKHNP